MSYSFKNRSQADTITLTRADLISLAEKLSGHEKCEISKPQALNMIAGEILGPKHDWAQIKNAKGQVLSQRAQNIQPIEPVRETELHTDLKDLETGDKLPARAYIRTDGTFEIKVADGTTVWVERNGGVQKIHIYNDLSDGPVSVRSDSMKRITVMEDAYKNDAWDDLRSFDEAGGSQKSIIGYQVDCPLSGENWKERPSFEILPLEVALQDYREAQAAGEESYRILTIREGDIEEPEFFAA